MPATALLLPFFAILVEGAFTTPPPSRFVFPQEETGEVRELVLSARSAVLVDVDTNKIVWQKAAETPRSIGSITKLISALVILDRGANFEHTLTLEKGDLRDGGIQRFLVGEQFTVRDFFAAALVASDNSAMSALARSTGLSHDEFVVAMNKKAVELGMHHTRFVDETGLSARNRSTALDLTLLLRATARHSELRPFFTASTWKTESRLGRPVSFESTNELTGSSDAPFDIVAAKTGYIAQAGYCFASLVEQNGKRLAIVVLHTPTKSARFKEALHLLFWANDLHLF